MFVWKAEGRETCGTDKDIIRFGGKHLVKRRKKGKIFRGKKQRREKNQ